MLIQKIKQRIGKWETVGYKKESASFKEKHKAAAIFKPSATQRTKNRLSQRKPVVIGERSTSSKNKMQS